MGLRSGFLRLLSRGEEVEPDPNDWCELVTIPQFEAPMLARQLELADIEVHQQESFNVARRTMSDMTFMVRRHQFDQAQATITS